MGWRLERPTLQEPRIVPLSFVPNARTSRASRQDRVHFTREFCLPAVARETTRSIRFHDDYIRLSNLTRFAGK